MLRKWKLSSGMLSYSSTISCSEPCIRVQFYWPELALSRKELYIVAKNGLRLVYDVQRGDFGAGFQVFGFGFGIARYR